LDQPVKTVQNWLADRNRPTKTSVHKIIKVMFGYGQDHAGYREELMRKSGLLGTSGKTRPFDPASADRIPADGAADTVRTDGSRSARVVSPDMPRHRLDLVGRDDELRQIRALLNADRPEATVGPVSVVGLPGLGKTSLALGYARRFEAEYDQVWWCRAESRASLLTSLSHLSEFLAPDTPRHVDTSAAASAALRALAERSGTWLIIYDNAPLPAEIEDLLPSAPTRLLLTSRHHAWKDWSIKFDLALLAPESASALLLRQASREDQDGANHLAQVLGYLPLALTHAARLCEARPSLSFSEYAGRASQMINVAPVGHPYPREVHATFTIAIQDAVGSHGRAAEEIMAIISYCGPDRIPETLVTSAFEGQSPYTRAILTLTEVSLIQSDPFPDGVPALSAHRLVQEVARERSLQHGYAKGAIEHIASWLAERLRRDEEDDTQFDEADTWEMHDQLNPHVIAVMNSGVMPKHQGWPSVLFSTGAYFLHRKDYALAEIFFREAGARTQAIHGRHHPAVAGILFHYGQAARLLGDHTLAKQRYDEALGIAFSTLPPGAELTAAIAAELGVLKARDADYVGACALLEKSLLIHRGAGRRGAMAAATVLAHLGDIARSQREFDKAIRLQTEAISLVQDSAAKDHPDILLMQSNLALCYQGAGDLDRARELLHHALLGFQERFGPNDANTIRVAHYLADVLADQGKMQEACDLLREAAVLCDVIEGPDYRGHSNLLQSLAGMLLAGGSESEALPHAERALALEEHYYGADHDRTRKAAEVLVRVLNQLGRDRDAGTARSKYGLDGRGS
jgi:tetratricopeptide (TPR) repeat protein